MTAYAQFSIAFHGLKFEDCGQLDGIRTALENYALSIHPGLRFDSDVEVEIVEHSGKCLKDHNAS
jgi:hypothetical protein